MGQQHAIHKFVLGTKDFDDKQSEFMYDKGWYSKMCIRDRYQLMDCFTLFYFKFLKSEPTDEHFWTNQINTPAVNTWLGLAFERRCV